MVGVLVRVPFKVGLTLKVLVGVKAQAEPA